MKSRSRDGLAAKGLLKIRLPTFLISIFQKGVVIIDSPGIGESDIMDEVVTNYLPEAFAFIYVINSENAGGVQRDRVSIVVG